MLDRFPIEVVEIIIDALDQESLVSLNLTSKKFHRLITPTFFKSVEVNHHKSLIGNDVVSSEDKSTRITSIYGLKVFLNALVNDPRNCQLVQRLVFKSLPDLPEDTLVMYFEQVFPHMKNLIEFKWYSTYNLDLKIINLIPNAKLNKLNGNFKNFDHFNNNNFKNLRSLSLSGFKNFQNINIRLDTFKNLMHLKISKKNLVLVEDDIENLLTNIKPLNLLALNLENLYLTSKDIRIIRDKINFKYLEVLKLVNCFECHSEFDNILENINDSNDGSLTTIEMNLNNHEHTNGYIFDFLKEQKELRSLSITINTASQLSKELYNLLGRIPESIINLDIDFCIKGMFSHQSLNFTHSSDIINQLNRFQKLQTLNVPISFQGLSELRLAIPSLKTVQFNIIDILKFKNSLINVDHTQLSVNYCRSILSQIHNNDLQFLIIKLFDYHILDIQKNSFNNLPVLGKMCSL